MKRKFTTKTKEEILARSPYCEVCGSNEVGPPHHAYSGTHRLPTDLGVEVLTADYNEAWNGVSICQYDHDGFHHTGKFRNGMNMHDNRILIETLAMNRYANRN